MYDTFNPVQTCHSPALTSVLADGDAHSFVRDNRSHVVPHTRTYNSFEGIPYIDYSS